MDKVYCEHCGMVAPFLSPCRVSGTGGSHRIHQTGDKAYRVRLRNGDNYVYRFPDIKDLDMDKWEIVQVLQF